MIICWYATMNFIHVKSFAYLFYLNIASVVSSMEFPGFSEAFSEIKLLVTMVTMISLIVFA